MKRTITTLVGIAAIFASSASWAYVNVDGYIRSNGTYVAPHIRTSPDGNPYNNFSSSLQGGKIEKDASPFNPIHSAVSERVV